MWFFLIGVVVAVAVSISLVFLTNRVREIEELMLVEEELP